MTLTTSPPAFDARASLRFPADLRLTCEQFELVCAENRDAVLELDADGRLIGLPPFLWTVAQEACSLIILLFRARFS